MRTKFRGWRERLKAISGGAVIVAASVVIVACGGGSGDADTAPSTNQTFESRAASLAATSPGAGSPPALSLSAQAEVQRRSREWAVAAITNPALSSSGSAMTVPPLYFGLAFAVEAAAHGETLAELRNHVAPVSHDVQAALQRGLERSVSAGAATTFATTFLDALTASQYTAAFDNLTLSPLSPQQLQLEPNLLMSVNDSVRVEAAWPQVRSYSGVHTHFGGQRLSVSMMEVQGAVLDHAGPGYQASSMQMPDGHWLVRVVPQDSPATFGATGLAAALAEVVPTLTSQAAGSARTGIWQLPQTNVSSTGLDDRRGMTLAMDRARADLRSMGGGGAYLNAPGGGGSLQIDVSGLRYFASQSFEFIFNPFNAHSGAGGFTNWGGSSTFTVCPAEPADVRPYFLAWVQPGGNLAMLARLDSYDFLPCID